MIDLSVPRHAQYLDKAWKGHQDAVFCFDINLAIKKERIDILSDSIKCNHFSRNTSSILYSESCQDGNWRSLIRKSIPRPPPKISLKHEWKRELGSEHAQRSEAGQLYRSFQSNQPILNPIRERTMRPVITHDVVTVQDERKTSRSQEIDVNSVREEPGSSEQTGRPATGRPVTEKPVNETSVIQARSSEDRKDFNVEQAHERTVRPFITHDVINVSDNSQTRSARES